MSRRGSTRSPSSPRTAASRESTRLPRGVPVNVQAGDRVRADESLGGVQRPPPFERWTDRAIRTGAGSPPSVLCAVGCRSVGPRREGAARVSRQRDPGGLPTSGRQHQRQAHRGHRPADDAVSEDRRGRRHGVRARERSGAKRSRERARLAGWQGTPPRKHRGAGGSLPVHGREQVVESAASQGYNSCVRKAQSSGAIEVRLLKEANACNPINRGSEGHSPRL